MSQCIRCEQICSDTSLLCEHCQLHLKRHVSQRELIGADIASLMTTPVAVTQSPLGEMMVVKKENALSDADTVASNPAEELQQKDFATAEWDSEDDASAAIISSQLSEKSAEAPSEELPTIETAQEASRSLTLGVNFTQQDVIEQSLLNLNDAARRIASTEAPSIKGQHKPRASRLSKVTNITDDIRRDSTPLPQNLQSMQAGTYEASTEETADKKDGELPDLWPWFQDPDGELDEKDVWSDHTDPLQARHFPSRSEIKHRTEENRLRGSLDRISTVSLAIKRNPRMRFVFICLTSLAILVLVLDSVLLSVSFIYNHTNKHIASSQPPSLTLSKSAALYGENVTLHILNFTPSTRVFLSRDINEGLHLNKLNPLLIGADGTADVVMAVENAWDPGMHTIEAEDVSTRYTASAILRIDTGPTRPAHLLIDATQVDFGANVQGANTIQQIGLHNSGGGTITWSASSDQPWLLISPRQGTFSDMVQITVAVQRTNLDAGNYTGTISFSSNVGTTQSIQATMSVRSLPADVGAVLAVSPAVLTFTATDGYSDPSDQFLVVSNPGKQPLYWSIGNNTSTASSNIPPYLGEFDPGTNWLYPAQKSGVVVPGNTNFVRVKVQSHNLLPGIYSSTLLFTASNGHSAYNSPQSVGVSLTVQPRCGLSLSTGSLSFTAVEGQANPGSQAISLTSSPGCSGPIGWSANASTSWLVVTPAKGQLNGTMSAVTTVSVNAAGLTPGTFMGNLSLTAPQSTESVTIQLIIQPPLPPSAPIIGAAPLNLNFSATPGQANPPGQAVTITNTGGSALTWHPAISPLASDWLSASSTSGIIPPGQTGQVTISVSGSNLTPGTYIGQIALIGVDSNARNASGSPQTISVNFTVLPPCTLALPTASALAFTATQGMGNPTSQTFVITASGNCSWPVSWNMALSSATPWLNITPSTGSFGASGQSAALTVTTNIGGLAPNIYSASASISATDASGSSVQGSPQPFTVSMTVLQPCSLQIAASGLTFTVAQGGSTTAQSTAFSATDNCAYPLSWTAASDSNWLLVTPLTGSDSGSGASVSANVVAGQLTPGKYNGLITITATGSGGATVQFSPQTVPVTLIVNGATLSGTVILCMDASCSATTQPPATATINLVDGSGKTIATTTTDVNGGFSFTNVANGTYTLSGVGLDSSQVGYSGSINITVAGDQSGISLNLQPNPTVVNQATGN